MTDEERTAINAEIQRLEVRKNAMESMVTAPMFAHWGTSAKVQHTNLLTHLTADIAELKAKLEG